MLRHQCTDSNQCDDDLICGVDNATKSTGFNRNPSPQLSAKVCLCDEENGYTEDVEDNACNGNENSNISSKYSLKRKKPFNIMIFFQNNLFLQMLHAF